MRGHDPTKKRETMTKTKSNKKTKTMTMTMTNTGTKTKTNTWRASSKSNPAKLHYILMWDECGI